VREEPDRHRGAAVLVIDDEEVVCDVLGRLLERAGYRVAFAATAAEGLAKAAAEPFDLVLLDLMLPDRSGMDVLRELLRRRPEQMVLMMTAFATVESAVEAMQAGAHHYLTKPFKNEEVLAVVGRALDQRSLREENRRLRRALSERHSRGRLVGKSAAMREVFALLDQVAPSRTTVLIEGESGTGKELIAQAIHAGSDRSRGPFVVVHSGNIPADLLESNLFGHTRGAFTGAVAAKKGLLEVADGGTVFFDEISTIRPEVQAKLLRVMQEREFLPLGATRSVKVDVRIVAATNVDLGEQVRRGEFREDLYYRLNVIKIVLPPLRDRHGDVPLLAEHFVRRFAAENGREAELAPEALERLLDYSWPGNVRELENAIERAVVLCRGPRIDVDLLPEPVRRGSPAGAPSVPEALPLQRAVEEYEKTIIERTLREAGGVQKKAAEMLQLRPSTLHEKIRRLGIKV
jgi:DNA-binding NtrC family response regulator